MAIVKMIYVVTSPEILGMLLHEAQDEIVAVAGQLGSFASA